MRRLFTLLNTLTYIIDRSRRYCLCAENMPLANITIIHSCGHQLCDTCLKGQFIKAVNDFKHMPPRCCCSIEVPYTYAAPFFGEEFKSQFMNEYASNIGPVPGLRYFSCTRRGYSQQTQATSLKDIISRGHLFAVCAFCNTNVLLDTSDRGGFHSMQQCKAKIWSKL